MILLRSVLVKDTRVLLLAEPWDTATLVVLVQPVRNMSAGLNLLIQGSAFMYLLLVGSQ